MFVKLSGVNKALFLFVILCYSYYPVCSQISVPGKPESFQLKTKTAVIIPSKNLFAWYYFREISSTGRSKCTYLQRKPFPAIRCIYKH